MLEQLLAEVDALFGDTESGGTLNYSLGRFSCGWSFDVTNSWHAWFDAGLEFHFGVYKTPNAAVQAFLYYVRENNINVAALTDKSTQKVPTAA